MVVSPMTREIRRDLARLLVDTCTVERKTGEDFDPLTGQLVPVWATLYSGPCRVRPGSGREIDAGEESLAVHMFEVTVPWDVDGVAPEDVVTVDSVDADLGVLVVDDVTAGSLAAFRKLICRRRLE